MTVGGDHLDLLGTGFNEANGAGPPEFSMRTDFILERGGKRERRIEVAEAAREVARLEFLNSTRTLILEVETAFADALLAKDNLALARENLAALNEVVEVNRARVRSGDLAEVELVRTRVAALQFQNAVRRADLDLRKAYTQLKLLLGRSLDPRPIEVTGELRRDMVEIERGEVERAAFARRPDLLALRQDPGPLDCGIAAATRPGESRLCCRNRIPTTAGLGWNRQLAWPLLQRSDPVVRP